MQTKEWTTADKSTWGEGPWQSEPDKRQWQTAAGLPGLVVRNQFGALCGYVGVPRTHPLHSVDYNAESTALDAALERRKEQPIGEVPAMSVLAAMLFGVEPKATPETVFQVHGGLTFSDGCQPNGICHEPDAGEDDRVWWFGFDCGHCDDLCPGMDARFPSLLLDDGRRAYRDIAYVTAEVESLARQLVAVAAEVRP